MPEGSFELAPAVTSRPVPKPGVNSTANAPSFTRTLVLRSTVEKLRAHVSKRVQELCGMSVSKMSIEISWLNPSSQIRKSLK